MTNNTIIINLINNSNCTFTLNKIIFGLGNDLTINKKILLPEQTAIIIGMTTTEMDLSGIIYFNEHIAFDIFVPLQFHCWQPTFNMDNNIVYSTVESKTFNPIINPRLLAYTKANIILKNII